MLLRSAFAGCCRDHGIGIGIVLRRFASEAPTPTPTPTVSGIAIGGEQSPSSVELRDYQTRDVDLIRSHAESGGNPLYVLPPGGGKSVVAASLVKGWVEEGRRAVVVVHRREILRQMADALAAVGVRHRIVASGRLLDGERDGERDGDGNGPPNAKTTLATIQTLARRADASEADVLRDADYVLVDEAHHATSKSYKSTLVDRCQSAQFVGVTATPFRLDGTGLGQFGFDGIIRGPTVPELIDAGFLVKPRIFGANLIGTDGVAVASGGDYDVKELSASARVATDQIVRLFLEEAWVEEEKEKEEETHCDPSPSGEESSSRGRRRRRRRLRSAIFFAVDVDHSIELRDALIDAGVPAEHVDSTTTMSDRDDIMKRFRDGEIVALTNCEIATEGFDVPTCSAIVLARPTKSHALFIQMFGRGLRVSPGKDDCLFFDCSGLVAEHGSPVADFKCSLESGLIRDEEEDASRVARERVGARSNGLGEELRSKFAFRFVMLKLVRLGGNKYALAGSDDDRGFDFDGFTFETDHTFSKDEFALFVANKDPGDAATLFDIVLFDDLVAFLRQHRGTTGIETFLHDVVQFIADPAEANVRDHYRSLLRIARERGYKRGWAFYRLVDRWGKEVAEKVASFKSSSVVDEPVRPFIKVISLPTSWQEEE